MEKQEEKREDILRSAIIKVVNKLQPELERKFDIRKIVQPMGTRGLLRDELKGKLYMSDRKLITAIFQDLKKEGIFYHIGGIYWSRIK